MSRTFLKMEGAGNDFLLLDDREGWWEQAPADRWSSLCARRTGIGADGVLLLTASDSADFRMRYLNADGYEAAMCGNGARCIAWAAAMESGLGRPLGEAALLPPGWEDRERPGLDTHLRGR